MWTVRPFNRRGAARPDHLPGRGLVTWYVCLVMRGALAPYDGGPIS